jgi:serine/threonine protein kinase
MDGKSQFGRYRLMQQIAVGGMAEVFLAEAEQARGVVRRCIVKRILPGLSKKEEFVRALIDEAKIGMLLAHPNLVTTLDFSEVDGRLFLALEHVDGPDLGALGDALAKQGQQLPIEAACTILCGVLRGLQAAHEACDDLGNGLAIIHRDINPPNILISKDGAVKVADFGIAHAASRLSHTRFGQLKGKIPYMSPEQAKGRRLDARSDLFSCGVVFFEMLTGGRLFAGTNEMEVLRQVQEATVAPPSDFCSEIPVGLDRICLKALQKDRDARYASAKAFLSDMEAFCAKHYPQFLQAQLAELVQSQERLWRHPTPIRQKTSVLEPDQKSAAPDPTDVETPAGFRALLSKCIKPVFVGVCLALCFGAAWGLLSVRSQGDIAGPILSEDSTQLIVRGGQGGYAFVDGRLLGKTPLDANVSTKRKHPTLRVVGPGVTTYQSGISVSSTKPKTVNATRKVRRAVGTLVNDIQGASIAVDGKALESVDGFLILPAGEHFIQWNYEGHRRGQFAAFAPGRVLFLSSFVQ